MNCPRHNRVRYAICQRRLISLTVCLVAGNDSHLAARRARSGPPVAVLQALWKLAVEGKTGASHRDELFRAIAVYSGGSGVVPLGFLLGGWFPDLKRVVNPLLRFLGASESIFAVPVFMVLFGIGEVSKFAMISGFPAGRFCSTRSPACAASSGPHQDRAVENASRGTILARVVSPCAAVDLHRPQDRRQHVLLHADRGEMMTQQRLGCWVERADHVQIPRSSQHSSIFVLGWV